MNFATSRKGYDKAQVQEYINAQTDKYEKDYSRIERQSRRIDKRKPGVGA